MVPINYLSERELLSVVIFFYLPYHALNLISFYIVALSCTAVCIVGLQSFFFYFNCFYLKLSVVLNICQNIWHALVHTNVYAPIINLCCKFFIVILTYPDPKNPQKC